MPKGLVPYKVSQQKVDEETDGHNSGMTTGEATLNIINRLLRQVGVAERRGVSNMLNQLEITPIPSGAVIPIANSVCKAAILDAERIKQRIPLVYVWLETYLLGQKGAKRFSFMLKDLAVEQLSGKIDENIEGSEGE
jgi:hypothetical protein